MELVETGLAGRLFTFLVAVILSGSPAARAQTITGRSISIGGMIGDPLGIALRCPIGPVKSLDVGFGPDYFGSPRLQVDYVWRFHAFHSAVICEYAGPGLAVAFAKGTNSFYNHEPHIEPFATQEDNRFELGGRAILGISFTPRSFPFEFFLESGPLIAATRIFDIDFDGAIGILYRL